MTQYTSAWSSATCVLLTWASNSAAIIGPFVVVLERSPSQRSTHLKLGLTLWHPP
jgi:hypothetical protein